MATVQLAQPLNLPTVQLEDPIEYDQQFSSRLLFLISKATKNETILNQDKLQSLIFMKT